MEVDDMTPILGDDKSEPVHDQVISQEYLDAVIRQVKFETEQQWKRTLADNEEKQRQLQLQVDILTSERDFLKENQAATKTVLDNFLQEYEAMQSHDKSIDELTVELQMERSARARLQEECFHLTEKKLAFAHQINTLQQQIVKYQQTETVLAQTVSHFQHQRDSRDIERIQELDRLKGEMDEASRAEVERAKEGHQQAAFSLELAQSESQARTFKCSLFKNLHRELEELRRRVDGHETQELVLRNLIQQLETDKAVLQSKSEQLQKTEAALRFKLNAAQHHARELQAKGGDANALNRQIAVLEKDNATLAQENAKLREKNTELNNIAVELVAQLESAQRPKADA
ncbi:hypothetical protein LEN26_001961 [Aphanomyces euteiches]|nr:hypothetical protein AeMF1_004813 [Aphanomyces euteiches]KAH9160236.1 hypothetical protein LEN26_001961 [Aphanomyces euteiches]KAH9186383.1 hypothetical protein AeNC1_011638 [Aphanomyces euteiches]